MKIKVHCAWCQKYLGQKETTHDFGRGWMVSHSICPDCARKMMNRRGRAVSAT